jgi:nucleotide-binding universal stress UspA family protein
MKTSSLRSILVSLNDVQQLPTILAATRYLAGRFGAQVKGLYVIPATQVYPMMGYDAVPVAYDGNQRFFEKHLDQVKSDFENAMKADGTEYSFQKIDGSSSQIAMTVADQSRAHDISIISVSNMGDGSGLEEDFSERVVMLAGRPVLVLPRQAGLKFDFTEIVLGWDGGREAARATFDAMPLLRTARRVQLLGIDVAPRGSEPAAEIADSLAHHGVKAEITHVTSDGMNAGETLLRAAKDHGAGLLVMGAYGHGRFTAFIFGGATRHVFKNLSLPVLMSH